MADNTPKPTTINLHKQSRVLEIAYDDGSHFEFTCEFLRVHSPSADVRGHGPGQGVLQIGKEHVTITAIEPVGNYAIKLIFDDGHQTGIYSWDYLYDMGCNQEQYWREYLTELDKAGHKRNAE
ncbi:MAG: gamma-butyrobetaine hydroxylase-like domain-containing protein [Gammaproteobacteria bacterium]